MDVGGTLLERVLPEPVDDVDDVAVVASSFPCCRATSCSKSRASDTAPFEASCAFFIERARL
jgi:hypothetical protein